MTRWFFIPHPAAHRATWRKAVEGLDGTEIETAFGTAVNIVTPTPELDSEWICDMCNELIEVYDPSGNPIPVISAGSYALCPRCVARAIRIGELSDDARELMGRSCGCDGCVPWLHKVLA